MYILFLLKTNYARNEFVCDINKKNIIKSNDFNKIIITGHKLISNEDDQNYILFYKNIYGR